MNECERIRRSARVMGVVATLLVSSATWAQPSANKAAADALFAEGRALMTQNKYAEACVKFAESERFEPAVGTSLNLGECHEKQGHTASAYGAFGEAKRLAIIRKDTEREEHAVKRRVALEPRLSKIALSVPPRVAEMKVFLDGQELGAGAIGAAIPVDPGEHFVEATAPDKPRFVKELQVPAGPVTVAVEVRFDGQTPAVEWSTARSAGVLVGTAGVVGMLAGGGFGIVAIVKNNDSKKECLSTDASMCSLRGVSLRNQAGTFADVSTGTLLAGGVLVGLGVGLFFLGGNVEPKMRRTKVIQWSPVFSPGFGGVMIRTEF